MPSTYSNIKIQLMATGENNTTWGNVTNINLGTALEEAIVGSADVTFASGNVTLTLTDTNASQTARHVRLRCTGVTGGSTRDLIVPAIEKPYLVQNDCLNSIVVKNATGTGITVPAGKTMWVYNDGTNVVDAVNHLSSLTLGTDLAVADGGTGASTFTANGIIYGNTTSALLATAAGTTGQVLVGNTGGAPSWATLTGIGVTSFSGGTTGLTPASPTTGAITLAGTLGVANGGTGVTSSTGSGSVVLSNSPTLVTPALGAATATSLTLTKLALTVDSPFYTGGNISSGANNLAIGTTGATVFGIFTNNNERMRIDASGNVGVATSTPTALLTVNGTAKVGEGVASNTSKLMVNTLSGVAAGIQLIQDANESWIIQNPASTNVLTFSNSGTERMRLNAAGDLGIGTATPGARLETSVTSAGATVEVLRLSNPGAGANTQAQINFSTTSTSYATITGGYGAAAPQMTFNLPSATAGNYIWQITGTERMRLDAAGNVGIGTSAPDTTLHVQSATGQIRVQNTTSGTALIGFRNSSTTDVPWVGTGGDDIRITTQSTERMRIDSSGNVGIGTATPGSLLELSADLGPTINLRRSGSANGNGAICSIGNTGTINAQITLGGGVSNHMTFAVNGSERMRIDGAGAVGIGIASPGFKLDVRGATGNILNVSDNSQSILLGTVAGGGGQIETGLFTSFVVNSSERMRIDSSGNVGIGTSTPTRKFVVQSGDLVISEFVNVNTSAYLDIADGIPNIMRLGSFSGVIGIAETNTTVPTMSFVGGAVGIGTSTPSFGARLTVTNAASAIIRLFNNSQTTGSFEVGQGFATGSDNIGYLYNNSNAAMVFGTNATERMRITAAGVVGINTSNPASGLDVNSIAIWCGTKTASSGSGGNVRFRDDTGTFRYANGILGSPAETSYSIYDNVAANSRLTITSAGNVGIGTITPNSLLQSSYGVPVSVPAAGTGGHGLAVGSSGYGLAAGALTSGSGYLQVTRWDSIVANYNLLLQPNGGDVGIGTVSPNAKLTVAGAATFVISGSSDMLIIEPQAAGSGALLLAVNAANTGYRPLTLNSSVNIFQTNNAERMRITSAGDVGIGTSAPISKFEVTGGYITSGTVSSTGGAKILAGQWSGTEHLTTFGSEYSSGGPALGYAVWPSTTTFASFVSATSVSQPRTAYTLSGGSHIWYTGGTQTVAVGSPVVMAETMRIDTSGNVGIGASSVQGGLNLERNSSANTVAAAASIILSNRDATSGTFLAGGVFSNTYRDITTSQYTAGVWFEKQNSATVGATATQGAVIFGANDFTSSGALPTERMRIAASGNVGIGTASPLTRLHVSGGSGILVSGNGASGYNYAQFSNDVGNGVAIGVGGSTASGWTQNLATVFNASNNPLAFGTNNTERMRIDSSGNLLVGTTSATFNASGYRILPSGSGSSVNVNISNTGGGVPLSLNTTADTDIVQFYRSSTLVGTISVTTTNTAYNTSSDERLKHDIVNAPEASSLIDAIKVRSFKWNADSSEQRYGFVAQELLTVAPEAVSVPADPDDMMGVDYSKLVPMLVKEIQSLRARVAQLEGK